MQRRISKFANGWWNVGKQRRRINKHDSILCPRCRLCRETTEHVLYCSRLSTETQDLRRQLKETIGSITPDTITNMLVSVLRQLSVEPDNSPRLVISPTLPPEVRKEIRQAIRERSAIGWPLLLRGYLAKSWTRAYSRLSGNGFESDTTKRWSTTVINCFWTYAFAMWKLRCTILHDSEQGIKSTKIDNEIRAHYKDKDLLLPIDRNLFHLSLGRMLTQNLSTKEAHLIGFKSAKLRFEASHDPDNLENVVNPDQRQRKKKKPKKNPTQTTKRRHHPHKT
jgi:hypothetical protein